MSLDLAIVSTDQVPALYAPEPAVARRTLEFFAVNIRNPNTRKAYARGVADFSTWCDRHGLKDVRQVQPLHVAAYVEGLQLAAPSVKQRLAALRMLFDWLVIGQVMPMNPASSVRGPRYSVKKGKTPVLSADEARALLDSIDTSTAIGLRDRALGLINDHRRCGCFRVRAPHLIQRRCGLREALPSRFRQLQFRETTARLIDRLLRGADFRVQFQLFLILLRGLHHRFRICRTALLHEGLNQNRTFDFPLQRAGVTTSLLRHRGDVRARVRARFHQQTIHLVLRFRAVVLRVCR